MIRLVADSSRSPRQSDRTKRLPQWSLLVRDSVQHYSFDGIIIFNINCSPYVFSLRFFLYVLLGVFGEQQPLFPNTML